MSYQNKPFICNECPNIHNPIPKQLECLRGKVPTSAGSVCWYRWTATLQKVVHDDSSPDIIHLPGQCPKCSSLYYLLLNQSDFTLKDPK